MSFFDDDSGPTHGPDDLDSLPFADDDDFDPSILDQHPFEIDDDGDFNVSILDQHPFEIDDDDEGDNGEQQMPSSMGYFTPTTAALSSNVTSTTDSRHGLIDEEDDSGYLSPLEGFVSLLDQSPSNPLYRPYFDQLTNAIMGPSSTRMPSTSSTQRPTQRPTQRSTQRPAQRTSFRKYQKKRGGYARRSNR